MSEKAFLQVRTRESAFAKPSKKGFVAIVSKTNETEHHRPPVRRRRWQSHALHANKHA